MSEAKFSDLGVRIASALVLAGVAGGAVLTGGWVLMGLIVIGVVLMLWEYRRMIAGDAPPTDPDLMLWCGAGAVVVLVAGFAPLWLTVLVAIAGAGIAIWRDRARAAWLAPAFLYVSLGLVVLLLIRDGGVDGLARALWVILCVIAADVGAYFAGRLVGGPKLWPRLSPKKTWAGALGGIIAAVAMGAVFVLGGWLIDQPRVLIISAVIAVASQAGDLAESWIKRRHGVKDSSALIPGHGGLLDRFDGLLGGLWAYGLMCLGGMVSG